jgi:hypothetical protein
MGIPGKLKSLMDRFQVFFMAKYMRRQPLVPKEKRNTRLCLFIAISGMKVPRVFDGAKATVAAFLDIIDCRPFGEILVPDMDTIRDIRTRPEILDQAYRQGFELGKALTG